jgi:hypothetical protein
MAGLVAMASDAGSIRDRRRARARRDPLLALVALDDRARDVTARHVALEASLARVGVDRLDAQRLGAQLLELVVELVVGLGRVLTHEPDRTPETKVPPRRRNVRGRGDEGDSPVARLTVGDALER